MQGDVTSNLHQIRWALLDKFGGNTLALEQLDHTTLGCVVCSKPMDQNLKGTTRAPPGKIPRELRMKSSKFPFLVYSLSPLQTPS